MSDKPVIGKIIPIQRPVSEIQDPNKPQPAKRPPTMVEMGHTVNVNHTCLVCGMTGQDYYTGGRPPCAGAKKEPTK